MRVIKLPGPKRNPKNPTDIAAEADLSWSGSDGRERARQAVGGMLAELGMDVGEASTLQIARALTREEFQARRLGQMLRVLYHNSPYFAAIDARPELASWRHEPVLDDYWRGLEGIERAEAATTRMLTELELTELSKRQPLRSAAQITSSVFEWCGLGRMLEIVYAGSPRAALRAVLVTPGIPPWRHERSPKGYWRGVEGLEHAQEATRTLIGEYGWAGLSAEQVAARVSRKMFLEHGLRGMLDAVYERRGYDALADIYPGLQPWQMSTAPHGYWTGPERRAHGRTATRWLIRRMGLRGSPLADIARRLGTEIFEANGLSGMLSCVYDNSPYAALEDVFPELRPWLVDIPAPAGYWVGEEGRRHAREAMRWMIGELGLQRASPAEVASSVDQALFIRMGLRGMFGIVYGSSPYAALSDLFPTLRPWQMRGNTPMRYWQGEAGREHAREATRWMLEQYGLENEDPTELASVIEEDMFTRQGLYGMLSIVYNGSCYAALSDLFPALPPRKPRTYIPRGHWHGDQGRERAREATRQMLASLGLANAEPADIAAVVDKKAFIEAGLGSPLHSIYGTSAYSALADLFPELRPWQMGAHAPQGCWQGEEGRRNGREATRHMLTQLGLLGQGQGDTEPADIARVARVARVVDADVFERAGLGTMLREVYAGSPYEALKATFPGLLPLGLGQGSEEGAGLAPGAPHLTAADFVRLGLRGMLGCVYGDSARRALADALPNISDIPGILEMPV